MAIYSRLVGGLGNQLFQYANGFAQSRRLGVDHIIDIRELVGRKAGHDIFTMDQFTISARIGRAEELPPPRKDRLRYLAWRKFGKVPKHFREKGFAFNAEALAAPDNTYFHGYFLSEKYFESNADDLRKELRVKVAPDPENAKWLNRISVTQAVSLHIRRGDYVGRSSGAICDADYYRRAVDKMQQQLGTNFELFIFSNDPDWVAENVALGPKSHVLSHNGPLEPVADLRLMATCDHHIIANSTLSWWGAWLNPSSEKIVIGPKIWESDKKLAAIDPMPTGWIKI